MAKELKPKVDETGHANARRRAHQGAFLAAYAQCAHIEDAATAAGIARSTHYLWMKEDPEYPALFAEAEELATQVLIDAAVRRGVHGWDEPVFHEGKKCGTIRKYSDKLLELGLRARHPAYRQKYDVEHTGKDGKPLIPLAMLDALLHGAPSSDDEPAS